MAEIDPLGEVYSGRDGSGAAYIIPSTRRTPVDTFYQEAQKRQIQQRALTDTYAKMRDMGNFKAWDRDLPVLQKMRNDYTTKLAEMQRQGIDPRTNPQAYKELTDAKDQMNMTAMASSEHKNLHDFWDKELTMNPDKYDPQSRANLEKWAAQPVDQRVENHDLGIVPYRDHNYLEQFDKTNAKANYAIKTDATNMQQVKGDSPYYTETSGVKFDEAGATANAESFLSQHTPHTYQALSDAADALAQQGVQNPTPQQIHQVAVQTLVSHAAQSVREESKQSVHFKPKPSVVIGNDGSGNERFAWGAEDVQPVAPLPAASAKFGAGNAGEPPVVTGAPMKAWSIKDLTAADNAPQVWTYNDGKTDHKITGRLVNVAPKMEIVDGKPKITYVANIAEPDKKNPMELDPNKQVIPGEIKQVPYEKLQKQIEVYTQGKKGTPGFNLDRLQPDWKVDAQTQTTGTDTQAAPAETSAYQKIKAGAKNIIAKLKWPKK